MVKRRLDVLLVERGLAESQAKARALVMAGEVSVDGMPALKAGLPIAEEALLTLATPAPFVGRGGIKLEYALDRFRLSISGKVAADIGASTGGFVDCLLKRGAARVYAIDVGRGQLDWGLRKDPRVVAMEGVNARYPLDLPQKVDLATIDVSFISVEKVMPSVSAALNPGGQLVVLVKPQFEALRQEVGKGGVIADPAIHARVLGRFIVWAVGKGYRLRGLVASPIAGASGNREFFALLG